MMKEIFLSHNEASFMNTLLGMSGEEIYDRYGIKRDETYTYTCKFPDGYFMDVKLVVCEEDSPYCEAVLFNPEGCQVAMTDVEEELLGEWSLEYNGTTYSVMLVALTEEKEVA